jgi:phage terminase large subunit-like protein
VIAGKIVAGPDVRNACHRFMRDLAQGSKRGLKFDLDKANHAMGFFPAVLKLNGGQFEGLPFNLHPAQAFIVGNLFGWVRADGTRRFRVAYIEMGKGNGKSPLLGGIGLYGMVADGEPRAEIYAAATKKDQAMILFRDAVAMVDQSPALAAKIGKSGKDDKVWNLFHEASNSFFRPISADDGQSGPRPHIGLVDELHEHKTGKVINMLSAGRKSRRQPMVVAITNSGTSRTSVCWEYRQAGIDVSAGIKDDDTMFAYICSMDDGDDPFNDERCWAKGNPLLDATITREYLRDEVKQARGMPSKESEVRRLNFCEWVEAHNPAFSREVWMGAHDAYTLADFSGMECNAGLDLSDVRDLTSSVLEFQREGVTYLWPFFWIPENAIVEKTKTDGVPYREWIRAGHVLTTPGNAINKDFVVAKLAEILGAHGIKLRKMGYDRWGIDVFKQACANQGVEFPLEPFGQGFRDMGPAVNEFERRLVDGQLKHPGNPCLTWNAANAVFSKDPAGNRKLDKAKATGRIDGMVASLMAVAVGAKPAEEKPTFQFFAL